MPFTHNFDIGPLNYIRTTNANDIIDQCRIQVSNPALPKQIKLLLYRTIVKISNFGHNFNEAPLHIHNTLILKLKACLAYLIGGSTLANFQIIVASCTASNLEIPAPPSFQPRSNPKLPSKRPRTKQCLTSETTQAQLSKERFDSNLLQPVSETTLHVPVEISEPSIDEDSRIASLLELPEPLRDAAIKKFFVYRKTRPIIAPSPRIESYKPSC